MFELIVRGYVKIITVLISVLFLSGFGWFSSIDCEDVADSIIYDEGISHLNDKERKVRRKLYEWYNRLDRKPPRRNVISTCTHAEAWGWLD